MVEHNQVELASYKIIDEALIDEAYYQLEDPMYEEDKLSDEDCDMLVRRLLKDAESDLVNWLDTHKAGVRIADVIHEAIWDYVDEHISSYIIEREKGNQQ